MKDNQTEQFGKDDIKIEAVVDRFNGFFKIQEYQFKHRMFNGGWSPKITREIFERGNAVGVFPYDPETDTVLMVEQVRIGALDHARSPWLYECIAGMVGENESMPDVAIREAEEEAGIAITELKFMLNYFASPGGTTEQIQLYVGKADISNAGGVFGLDYEGEDIRVHVFKLDDALAMINNGKIDNAAAIIGLQWLALNRQNLQSIWND